VTKVNQGNRLIAIGSLLLLTPLGLLPVLAFAAKEGLGGVSLNTVRLLDASAVLGILLIFVGLDFEDTI